jgi:hypothetical protein
LLDVEIARCPAEAASLGRRDQIAELAQFNHNANRSVPSDRSGCSEKTSEFA